MLTVAVSVVVSLRSMYAEKKGQKLELFVGNSYNGIQCWCHKDEDTVRRLLLLELQIELLSQAEI